MKIHSECLVVNNYGRLILKFKFNATTESESRSINGTRYPPVADKSDEQAVAINDAHIRLKFMILRFVAKCFCP